MYMRMIEKWSIRVRKEFANFGTTKISFALFKDEDTEVCEMDITELRKLKEFMEDYKDPFGVDNPDHVDKLE
jgi:hypothetical protein